MGRYQKLIFFNLKTNKYSSITIQMTKKLKTMSLIIISIISLLTLGITLFINLSPEFGGSINQLQKMRYEKSENYNNGKFVNEEKVNLDMSLTEMGKSIIKYINPPKNTSPNKEIAVEKLDSLKIATYKGKTRLIWFGHSTFLMQTNTKNILIDPMFGITPAPHPTLGSKRFSTELPIEIEQLPNIDAVLISHDHYDHLDYGSIQLLKNKVGIFYTPLGVGTHLMAWGIEEKRIIELDWWQEQEFEGLKFACTPAQHFSGRGLTNRSSTLWCSWVIQSETESIFFSGDSGYGPHFKEIGNQYGPFDFAMLECGQYNEMWSEIHMFPEETVQAGIDVKAKKIMPIHWGAFKLAMHNWAEPVERIIKKANSENVNLIVPKIGEIILLDSNTTTKTSNWWEEENN